MANKHRTPLLIGLVLLLPGTGAATYWAAHGRYIESTDNAYIEASTTALSPQVAGIARTVPVRENTPVHAGDILLTIDDRDYRARLQQAEARQRAANAALARLDQQLNLQQSLIAEAKAARESALAEKERAEHDAHRYDELATTSAASRQQQEDARADARKARAELAANDARLQAARRQQQVLAAQRVEAEAALQQAKSDLELAQLDLDHTVIRAPFDGVVGNKQVEAGQYLRPGVQIMSLVPLPLVYITANFKETQLEHMQQGQQVTITVDAFPNQPISGEVESFSPASGARFSLLPPENATGNFTKIVQRIPVRIRVAGDTPLKGALRPGMSVVVDVDTRSNGERPQNGQGLAEALQRTEAGGILASSP